MAVSIYMQLFSISLVFLFTIVITPFFLFEPKTIPITKSPSRELHGSFLHITDFHPDPHYVSNVTARSRCHGQFQESKRPKHMKRGISGPWGAPATVCDSPLSLIDATFEWLEKNWKGKIDFIIWTGDNVRHDNDENIPRTPEEIFQLNRFIAEKFIKTFSDKKKKHSPYLIPIIPSIGNNDIYPNNIILPGPNHLLKVLYEIWSPFIPKGQHKNFVNGGYFYTEVIPKKLMVVSLNTLYFYKANTAVNGCKAHSQPGTNELKWLDGVLKNARKNGMKVYLTGHVGPRPNQYMRSCYRKYGQLSLKYHDVILGHFYGHSNLDHFFFIGEKEIRNRRNRRRRRKQRKNKITSDDMDVYDEEDDDGDDDNDDDYDDDDNDDDYDDDDNDDDYDDDDNNNDDDYEDDEIGDDVDEVDEDDEILKVGNKNEQIHFETSQEGRQDENNENNENDENNEDDENNGKVETNVYNMARYMNKLLRHYNKVARSKSKEFAVININPSIIPTFFPALRIFNYNTTEVTNVDTIDTIDDEIDLTKKRKRKVRHPNAPSHVNTFLTPLGYTQYFINLTHANLYSNVTPEYEIEYTTRNEYRMKDLTVSSWVQLARKVVSHGFRSSLWKKIQGNMMVGTRSLVREKSKRHYKNSGSREKGPEDYISELEY